MLELLQFRKFSPEMAEIFFLKTVKVKCSGLLQFNHIGKLTIITYYEWIELSLVFDMS